MAPRIVCGSAYAGEYLRNALAGLGAWCFEIIRRSDDIKGFAVLARRWVVERTFAWLGRCRMACQGLRSNHSKRRRLDPHLAHPAPHAQIGEGCVTKALSFESDSKKSGDPF
jgi:transposase